MLKKRHINFKLADNAFIDLDSWNIAQDIANSHLSIKEMHRRLDRFAEAYCPVFKRFGVFYHWSVMQAEYATDLVFKHQKDLGPNPDEPEKNSFD